VGPTGATGATGATGPTGPDDFSHIGGISNYWSFDADGIVTLAGTAKIVHHMQIPVTSVVVGSAITTYGDVIAGAQADQNSDVFYLQSEVFSSWDGTSLYFEVDWLPKTDITNGQTVIWDFTWRFIAEGEDIDSAHSATAATDTITYTAVGTVSAGTIIHSRVTLPYNHANQPPAENDHVFLKIIRNATTDTYGGTVLITAYEYIWTANALSMVN
jgi:hypothetical protein